LEEPDETLMRSGCRWRNRWGIGTCRVLGVVIQMRRKTRKRAMMTVTISTGEMEYNEGENYDDEFDYADYGLGSTLQRFS